MPGLDYPSQNRVNLIGKIIKTKLGVYAEDQREQLTFIMVTHKLIPIRKIGQLIEAEDRHVCTLFGDRVIKLAKREIFKNAWVHIEGYIRYRDKPDERYPGGFYRYTDIVVEFYNLLKPGDETQEHIRYVIRDPNTVGDIGKQHKKFDEYNNNRNIKDEPNGEPA